MVYEHEPQSEREIRPDFLGIARRPERALDGVRLAVQDVCLSPIGPHPVRVTDRTEIFSSVIDAPVIFGEPLIVCRRRGRIEAFPVRFKKLLLALPWGREDLVYHRIARSV